MKIFGHFVIETIFSALDLELGTVTNGGLKVSFSRRSEDEDGVVASEVSLMSHLLQVWPKAFDICRMCGKSP